MLNSFLSNINDDGDNKEKTKNLKTRVEMFKNGWEYSMWEFLGGNFPGASLMGKNFPGGSFPDTNFIVLCFIVIFNFISM